MADIRVEPDKKSTPNPMVWVWVLVVLAIAAIAYFLLRDNNTNETERPADTTSYNSSLPEYQLAGSYLYYA
jgi:hypothetical protein